MKKIFLIYILFANTSLFSQGNWEVIDIPSLYNPGFLSTLYYDSLENDLWIAGYIKHVDSIGSVPFNFVLKYDGINWKHYGPFLGLEIRAICRYQDKIVIGGSFFNYNDFYAVPDDHCSLAFIRADTVGHFNTMGAITLYGPGIVAGLNVINDELYVYGIFDSICGIAANNAAKFNGTTWSTVNDFPDLSSVYLTSGAKYNDEMYIGGLISDNEYFGSSGTSIVYYQNPDWELVGGGINYGLATEVEDMVIYKDELYVAGQISKLSGNAGNGIQKWNGNEWSAVGDHIRGFNGELGSFNPVYDLELHNNELYIAGNFEYAGDLLASRIVKWDGEKYCSFGGTFDFSLQSVKFWGDTMYVAGTFQNIDGINTHSGLLAKYLGGNSVFECGEVSIKENDALLQLDIYPSLAIDEINIYLPKGDFQNLEVEVYNLLGQKVLNKNTNATETKKINIPIQNFSKGQYMVLLKEKGVAIAGGRFIKE